MYTYYSFLQTICGPLNAGIFVFPVKMTCKVALEKTVGTI